MSTQKFPWGRTFLLGFGYLGISIIWPIFNQYIPLFLQAGNPEFERQLLAEGRAIPDIVGFGLAPSLALFIMTWDNIINMFVLDLAWRAGGSIGFCFHSCGTIRDRNCRIHSHHELWHGIVPLSYDFLAGRFVRTERPQQGQRGYQSHGGCWRTTGVFRWWDAVQLIWPRSSIYCWSNRYGCGPGRSPAFRQRAAENHE